MKLIAAVTILAEAMGSAGTLAARPPHPEPRVIVTVTRLGGPHDRNEVERAARGTWGRIVHCYKTEGRGKTGTFGFRLTISGAGRVRDARVASATLDNERLGACLLGTLRRVAMPNAAGSSTAHAEIYVAPGNL